MTGRYDLSVTEKEIMEVIWDRKDYMKTRELFEIFNERGKQWKRQTLNTLLIRLDEIGVITRRRSEVIASYSREEYRKLQTQDILDRMYDGKLENFMAALCAKSELTENEAEKLQNLFHEFQ